MPISKTKMKNAAIAAKSAALAKIPKELLDKVVSRSMHRRCHQCGVDGVEEGADMTVREVQGFRADQYGVADIPIAVTDGLKGMPEALGAVFPDTTLQMCPAAWQGSRIH